MLEHLKIALKEYGQREIIGNENNPKILEYFKEIGFSYIKKDETPWCAAFVNWVLKQAGKIGTNQVSARSFLKYGTQTKTPKLGDIVILWRDDPKNTFGHVGFYISENQNVIYVLGGNQNDSVNITAFKKSLMYEYRQIPI